MNTNSDLPRVNKFFFNENEPKESPKFIGTEEEQNWMVKALEDIKNSDKGLKLTERISHQVGMLSSFTPDQIVRLVNQLDQWIKREPDSKEATNYLCQAVALIIRKDVPSFENFLKHSHEKNFAIQVMFLLVREFKLLPLDAVKNLKKYGIDPRSPEGQQAVIEIAKLAAQLHSGTGPSENIKNYGIDASTPEGRQALIEIAKLAAQQDGAGTSENIKNYEIDASTPEGRQALIEIAKLAAQQDGAGTSKNIKNYGIDASTPEGRQGLIEIAKLAIQRMGEFLIPFFQYIKEYGIDASTSEGQQALIELAKLAAQQDGAGTSKYIKEYGIDASTPEGRQALIEIAKLAAQQNGYGISQWIQKYGIDASTPEGRQVTDRDRQAGGKAK